MVKSLTLDKALELQHLQLERWRAILNDEAALILELNLHNLNQITTNPHLILRNEALNNHIIQLFNLQ